MRGHRGHGRRYFDSRQPMSFVGFNLGALGSNAPLNLTRCLPPVNLGRVCLTAGVFQTSQTTAGMQLDGLFNGKASTYTPISDQISLRSNVRSIQLRDTFVRDLLCRFLVNLWGSQVTLCFFRNLQRFLSLQECVFVRLQQHRVFSLAPAPCYTPKQRERYP
jgi:hypothetical protein